MHETGCWGLAHWGDPEGWDGEGGGRGVQNGEHMYTHGRFKSMHGKTNTILRKIKINWITNQDLLYSTGNSAQCYVAAFMGGEFRREGIHFYVQLSPSDVHLKLSQHC